MDEYRVGDEPDAVPRARRFVSGVLARRQSEVAASAVSVATELVTNALLHAGPPLVLRITQSADAVRLEVEDKSREVPVRALDSDEAMTGRGLALVGALSRSWGVSAKPGGGKLVWADLSATVDESEHTEADIDADALLAVWGDSTDAGEPAFTIHLGDVPTDLLLAAKAHVDNLVREFTLTASGASSGNSQQVPPPLAALIDAVVHRFASPRQAIKRQALAAAAVGAERTDLTLTLPLSAAEAGEQYLAALDEADAYARAARLLTLETPPAHRVFRRWYVESLIDQLRRHARGEPVERITFERRLIDELGAVAAAQRASDRSARLQAVTAALAGANTVEEVAQVVVAEGVAALLASGGCILVFEKGKITIPASDSYSDELLGRLQASTHDAELIAVAGRVVEPVFVESPHQRNATFPELARIEPAAGALCVVPLMSANELTGTLRFSFTAPRFFDEDERGFVKALAAQAAQAMHRSEIYAAERAARDDAERLAAHLAETADRLSRLQRVTTELTGARDIQQIADVVVTHAAEAFGADSARIYLARDEWLEAMSSHGGDPEMSQKWARFPISADLPGGEALRSGAPVVINGLAELARRFPALAGVYPDERSLLVAPLRVGEHNLGVLSLTFRSARQIDHHDQLVFLTTLADASAQALERALATTRAVAATDRLAFLAAASVELSGSLEYRTTVTNVARMIVPRIADWCTVHVAEDGELRSLVVHHIDPQKIAWAQQLQEKYPIDPNAPTGVPNVIRTGVSELYADITDEMIAVAARDEEHLGIIRRLGMSSVLVVPLTGRTGTFGAITLILAESGRHYGPDDLTFAEDLARRVALAIETVTAFREQSGRLAAVSRVAEAAQLAILAPVPTQVGSVALRAAYRSAAADALIGGDLYEVVRRSDSVRLLIGDVRGKGLDAVRKATIVLGEFRAAAVDRDTLVETAVQMDARLRPYLGDEDFVTALLAEITDDGLLKVACCGHPPALLSAGGAFTPVGVHDSLPLGLGAAPSLMTVQLAPGDRLFLYTDGIVEARDANRRFVELAQLVQPLAQGEFETVLDRILEGLRDAVGDELGDDLALLVAEYRPA